MRAPSSPSKFRMVELFPFVSAIMFAMLLIPGCDTWPEMTLTPAGQITSANISESSGIVSSAKDSTIFWTHNDSGGDPRIFPIHKDGSNNGLANAVTVPGAQNNDWEDISRYKGGLLLADIGNNSNNRKDLRLYHIAEPDPAKGGNATLLGVYPIVWSDQKEFPPPSEQKNFDCEAVYSIGNSIYFLTKHRGDTKTKLYRLKDPKPNVTNTAEVVSSFDPGEQVTGADATDNGKRVTMLTYKGVWVFTRPKGADDDIFKWDITHKSFDARQCEAITFHKDTLIITNEQRDIFHISLSELTPVSK